MKLDLKDWLDQFEGEPSRLKFGGVYIDVFRDRRGVLPHALNVFEDACELAGSTGKIAILVSVFEPEFELDQFPSFLDLEPMLEYPPLVHYLEPEEEARFWGIQFPFLWEQHKTPQWLGASALAFDGDVLVRRLERIGPDTVGPVIVFAVRRGDRS